MVSNTSVIFTTGASDGEERCITITAICDDQMEEDETVLIVFPSSSSTLYVIDASDNGFTGFLQVIFMDNDG